MRIRDWKNFVYIPTIGFIEVIVGEIVETENHKFHVQYRGENKALRDQTIFTRLQTEYPGCTIIQNGDLWGIVPNKKT